MNLMSVTTDFKSLEKKYDNEVYNQVEILIKYQKKNLINLNFDRV